MPPRSAPASPARLDLRAAALLLGLALVIVAMRWPSLREPLERDIGACMVIASEMLHGRALYREIFEIKPPGLSLTCMAGILIAGYTPEAVFILGLAAAILTMLGAYYAGSAGPGGRLGGLCAAAFWTAIQADFQMQANLPNTEAFINIYILFAFGLMVRWRPGGRPRWARAVGVGLLFAIATLYKQVAISIAATLAAAHLLYPAGGIANRRSAFKEIATMAATGAVVWAGFFAVLFAADILAAYYYFGIDFIDGYSGSVFSNLGQGLRPGILLPEIMLFMVPLAFLALLGAFVEFWKDRRSWALLIAYAAGVQVAVAMPGHFFAHYYQYWMPWAAVGAAWGMAALRRCWREQGVTPRAWKTVLALVLIVLAGYEGVKYRFTPREWSRIKYGSIFVAAHDLVPTIDSLLEDGETFYQWGAECALYLYTQRPVATGIFYMLPMLYDTKQLDRIHRQTLDELRGNPPELAIVDIAVSQLPDQPVLQWIYDHYEPIRWRDSHGVFMLYALNGGALQQRLEAGEAAAR